MKKEYAFFPFEIRHRNAIVSYSPDGNHIAFGSGISNRVKIIDQQGIQLMNDGICDLYISKDNANGQDSLLEEDKRIAMAYSPDGKHLAIGGRDKSVTIYDTKTYHQVKTILLKGNVFCIAYSPNSKYLAVGCSKSRPYIMYADTLQPYERFERPEEFIPFNEDCHTFSVQFSPMDSNYVAVANGNNVAIYNIETREIRHEVDHGSHVCIIQYSLDGLYLYVGGYGNSLTKYNLYTKKSNTIHLPSKTIVNSIKFTHDGNQFAVGCSCMGEVYKGRIYIYDTTTQKKIYKHKVHDEVLTLEYSTKKGNIPGHPGHNHIFVGTSGNNLKTFDTWQHHPLSMSIGSVRCVSFLALDDNEKNVYLAIGYTEGEVRLFDPIKYDCIKESTRFQITITDYGEIRHLDSSVNHLEISSDNKLISCACDRKLYVLNASTLEIHTNHDEDDNVLSSKFSGDGGKFLAILLGNKVKVYSYAPSTNTYDAPQYVNLGSSEYRPRDISFARNNKLLIATGSISYSETSQTLRTVNIDDNQSAGRYESIESYRVGASPRVVACSNCDKYVAIATNASVIIFNVQTNLYEWEEKPKLKDNSISAFSSLAFSPDDKILAIGNEAGELIFLRCNRKKWSKQFCSPILFGDRIQNISFVPFLDTNIQLEIEYYSIAVTSDARVSLMQIHEYTLTSLDSVLKQSDDSIMTMLNDKKYGLSPLSRDNKGFTLISLALQNEERRNNNLQIELFLKLLEKDLSSAVVLHNYMTDFSLSRENEKGKPTMRFLAKRSLFRHIDPILKDWNSIFSRYTSLAALNELYEVLHILVANQAVDHAVKILNIGDKRCINGCKIVDSIFIYKVEGNSLMRLLKKGVAYCKTFKRLDVFEQGIKRGVDTKVLGNHWQSGKNPQTKRLPPRSKSKRLNLFKQGTKRVVDNFQRPKVLGKHWQSGKKPQTKRLSPRSSPSINVISSWKDIAPDNKKRVELKVVRVHLPDLGSFESLLNFTSMEDHDVFETISLQLVIDAHWSSWAKAEFLKQSSNYLLWLIVFTSFCFEYKLKSKERSILSSLWLNIFVIVFAIGVIYYTFIEIYQLLMYGRRQCSFKHWTYLQWMLKVVVIAILSYHGIQDSNFVSERLDTGPTLMIISALGVSYLIIIEIFKMIAMGLEYYTSNYFIYMKWFQKLMVIVTIVLQYSYGQRCEDQDETCESLTATVTAFTLLFAWFELFDYLRAFEQCAWIIFALYRMAESMKYFIVVLFLVILPFSVFFRAFEKELGNEETFGNITTLFFAGIVGDFDLSSLDATYFRFVSVGLIIILLIVLLIISLNALIAFISERFEYVLNEKTAILKRQKATVIVELYCLFSKQYLERIEGSNRWTSVIVPASQLDCEDGPKGWDQNLSRATKDDLKNLEKNINSMIKHELASGVAEDVKRLMLEFMQREANTSREGSTF